MRVNLRRVVSFLIVIFIFFFIENYSIAQELPTLRLEVTPSDKPQDVAGTLQLLGIVTVLALAPSIAVMVTSFTRIIVVLSFLRSSLGTQQIPPGQVITALALFLTFFTMFPTFSQIEKLSWQPYIKGEITFQEAINRGVKPLREFMFRQTRENDLALFVKLSKIPRPNTRDDVPTYVLIPAFMISELSTAFQMGFMLYLPFLVIDMIVASILMSMGMLMLPPVMISLPFKLLLFVLVDGWSLVVNSLVQSFR
ncbi:flagellar type III secretion system pore protein FliP [bacterium]|nr:flagellar type III secretion system pore protein FliP [bacterium]